MGEGVNPGIEEKGTAGSEDGSAERAKIGNDSTGSGGALGRGIWEWNGIGARGTAV